MVDWTSSQVEFFRKWGIARLRSFVKSTYRWTFGGICAYGGLLISMQTFVKLTATPLNRYCSSFKAQILKYSAQQVQRSEISQLIVCYASLLALIPHLDLFLPFIAENKVAIVLLGGLTPLIRQMMSPNVEVQCNAVGCITNLATHEENKAKIARSGALGPLTRLAKSKDMRVQRNATGALLNMTHSGRCSLLLTFRLN